MDLAALGTAGFRISGDEGGQLGFTVDGAGDVDGDGLADVIVGDPSGGEGHAYVVFGSRTNADVSVDSLGARGFAMAAEDAGFSVAGVGDMQRRRRADVAVTGAGAAYVVFGGPSTDDVDLRALGVRGFRVSKLREPDAELDTVAAAGDVNGDGRPDLIFGSQGADTEHSAGAAWVVFGSGSTRDGRHQPPGRPRLPHSRNGR